MGFIAEIESDPRLNLKMQIESRLTATKYKKRKANEGEDKDKEYEYDCAKCGVTRVVKGTKPKAGWDCGDGGYACKRRYKCKSCSRTIIREDDPSDELECRDVGKACLPPPKKKRKN